MCVLRVGPHDLASSGAGMSVCRISVWAFFSFFLSFFFFDDDLEYMTGTLFKVERMHGNSNRYSKEYNFSDKRKRR